MAPNSSPQKNMQKNTFYWLTLFCFFILGNESVLAREIISIPVDSAPIIDGAADDPAWLDAPAIVTHDKVADIPITLRTVYTNEKIYFLVSFPDPDESRTHKNWSWSPARTIYDVGNDREDLFIFKWNMTPEPANLSIYADNDSVADVWFWKACRTDPAGFADDKMHILKKTVTKNSSDLISKSGKKRYLTRVGDSGTSSYEINLQTEFSGNTLPRYTIRPASGSRGDVRAKGRWHNGIWTLEFARLLQTGHTDDLQFDPTASYQFGVSRYEIAGRKPNPKISQPLYGCGDVNEALTLSFKAKAR